jgi:hypothetical protein
MPARIRAAGGVVGAVHRAIRAGRQHRRSAFEVKGLRPGEIPNTGQLQRILFNEKMEELRRESLFVALRQRIRDVRQGPDGLL